MNQNELDSLLDLFDLDKGFSNEELKVAYRELVQIWHPDRFAQNDRLQLRAQKKLQEINDAHTKLQDYFNSNIRSAPKKEPVYNKTPVRKNTGFLKTVFHPTDFSKTSEIAFAHALRLAYSNNSKLNLLHVSPNEQDNVMEEFPQIRKTLKLWKLDSENGTDNDNTKDGFRYQKVVGVHDNPAESILHFLSKHPADLTVLATSQKKGADRLLHKSVAEDVSRSSGGMTLFIPNNCRGFVSRKDGKVSLKNILIPIDHKPNPQLAINTVIEFIKTLQCKDSEITLLFIGDASHMPVVEINDNNGWQWKRIIRRGNVVDVILKTADEISADLIVMATKGHQGFLDALRGSTTEQVLRDAKYPLLAVPANINKLS